MLYNYSNFVCDTIIILAIVFPSIIATASALSAFMKGNTYSSNFEAVYPEEEIMAFAGVLDAPDPQNCPEWTEAIKPQRVKIGYVSTEQLLGDSRLAIMVKFHIAEGLYAKAYELSQELGPKYAGLKTVAFDLRAS